MLQLQTPETIVGILKRVPQKAFVYLLICVVAELAWIAVPVPRTDAIGNLMGVVLFGWSYRPLIISQTITVQDQGHTRCCTNRQLGH